MKKSYKYVIIINIYSKEFKNRLCMNFHFELDDFQKEACQTIDNGESVVVCAPTGAGKTVIAQHAIHRALEQDCRIFLYNPR